MSGDFESARESFNSFISKTNNIDDKSKAHYNIGNSFLTEYAKEAKEKGQAPSSDILKNAIKDLQKEEEMKGLILDLRSNPGGLLNESVDIVNLFVEKGEEVVSTKGKIKSWEEITRHKIIYSKRFFLAK
mgnify:CR=1 FL=1